ncbi:hypothetical protein [Kribbella sp. CA-247076]|uniref:hypothetical protein n=1 Tax=Kribbella sp. CA-247076 TaxID=3239941 RepID=UPI003D924F4A
MTTPPASFCNACSSLHDVGLDRQRKDAELPATNRLVDFRAPYVPQDRGLELRASALALIGQILSMKGVDSRHQRELLSIGLWKWTEAPGITPYPKYNVRYVSRGVRGEDVAKINHEHVWPRKWMIDRLRAQDWTVTELETFLDTHGVACVVTTEEHARLGAASGQGWQRYDRANIDVWDRQLGRWAELHAVSVDVPPELAAEPEAEDAEADVVPTAGVDLQQVLRERAGKHAFVLGELARWTDVEGAVAVVGGTRDPQQPVGAYFRIHDTEIEEPTPAAAYAHWNGRVSFRLVGANLPAGTKVDGVKVVSHQRYGVECRVSDDRTLELAKELLFLALEKLRGEL